MAAAERPMLMGRPLDHHRVHKQQQLASQLEAIKNVRFFLLIFFFRLR